MNNKDKQRKLGRPKIECLIYKKNKKAFIKRAREIVEAEVGHTGDSFWLSLVGQLRTTYQSVVSRASFNVVARLAYHSATLWILEGTTYRNSDHTPFYWTIEVHKTNRQQEDLIIWTYGQDTINGGV